MCEWTQVVERPTHEVGTRRTLCLQTKDVLSDETLTETWKRIKFLFKMMLITEQKDPVDHQQDPYGIWNLPDAGAEPLSCRVSLSLLVALWWLGGSDWCSYGPGYSKTAAAPIPVPMHMDTTPYPLQTEGAGSQNSLKFRGRGRSEDPPPASAPQLVQQSHHLPRPRAAQGVSQSDGPPTGVHLLHGDAQLLHAVHRLRSSRTPVHLTPPPLTLPHLTTAPPQTQPSWGDSPGWQRPR